MTVELAEKEHGEVPVVVAGQVRGLAGDTRDMIGVTPGLLAYNIAYLALAWIIAIAAIGLFWLYPAWYTFALAFLIVSSRQQALLNVEHECVHRKFVNSRVWNERIGRYLCAGPVGSPFSAAQARHLSHHRLLGTPEDPDHDLHAGERLRTRGGLVRHFVGGLIGGYAGMVLMGPRIPDSPETPKSKLRDLSSLVLCQGLIAAGLTLAFDWWVYPALWLAPLATATVFCHLLRSFVEHAITDDETREHSNRLITIRSNLLERELVAPYKMNYHAEHHLIPSVPAPRLKRLQKRLRERSDTPSTLDRSSYGTAVLRYARSLRG
jgi:fatty acid desaturase